MADIVCMVQGRISQRDEVAVRVINGGNGSESSHESVLRCVDFRAWPPGSHVSYRCLLHKPLRCNRKFPQNFDGYIPCVDAMIATESALPCSIRPRHMGIKVLAYVMYIRYAQGKNMRNI